MKSVCIVIPSYKSKGKLSKVLEEIETISNELKSDFEIKTIVVNDNCPLDSWKEIKKKSNTQIIHNKKNMGVGASTLYGFKIAIQKGFDAVIRLDSDGQHSPLYLKSIIPYLFSIPENQTILIKGSRYLFRIDSSEIPWARKIGSILLEPIARAAISCRGLSDISNGFFAMNNLTCRILSGAKFGPKLKMRYLFESSLMVRTTFFDIPIHVFAMSPKYGDEWQSSMQSKKMIVPLILFWVRATVLRILNNYIFRLNLGSLLLSLFLSTSLVSINLFFSTISPSIKADITVSAGNSTFFTTSSAVAIFSILLFFLYDYTSGKKAKSLIFPEFLEELKI